MAVVEAILVYRTDGIGGGDGVPVARTSDPEVLQTLRSRLLLQAAAEVVRWTEFDPAIGAMKAAEARRLVAILDMLVPDESVRPSLRIVPNAPRSPEATDPSTQR